MCSSKYSIFARTIRRARPYRRLHRRSSPLPIGREFWSRPLLNRDWAVRARAADAANSPLLLTGRYGAGRVAIFASSLATTAGPQAQAFWTQVIKWLGQDEAAPQPVAPPATPLAVSISGEAEQSLGGEQQNVIDGASGSGKLAPLEKPNTVFRRAMWLF